MDVRKPSLSREQYEAQPKFCVFCATQLPYEKRRGKFCNQSCSASFNNQGVTRHSKGDRFCSCGSIKQRHNSYCATCIEKQVYRGLTFEVLKHDVSRKQWLLKEREHRCEVCGLAEWMGRRIPIELDHIDGNADNNARENLRLICPNCHAQTETYKGANTGINSTRQQIRRRRYKNGQTY